MLNKFKHGVRTNINEGIINNQDACLIALYRLSKNNNRIVTSAELKNALREWRPGLKFTYLFNTSAHGGYGFVGSSWTHSANRVNNPRNFGSYLRNTYWYRVNKGEYAMTLEGRMRLEALGIIK